jgi:hypothetical protein
MKPLYANNGRKNKLLRGITCLLLAAALLLLSGCSSLTYKLHHEEVKQHMEAHLKERYGIDFETKPYLFELAFWSNNSYWEAEAAPAGQPEMKFKVRGSKRADSIDYTRYDDDKYTDNYLNVKWPYQAKQEIEKKLREVYGPDVDFNIRAYKFEGGSYALKDLDFDQLFQKNYGHGEINLDYDIFMDSTQFNKAVEAKRIYPILKRFVLDSGSDSCSIHVQYVDKACKQDYLSNSRLYLDNWFVQHRKQHYNAEYVERIKDKNLLNCFGWSRKSKTTTLTNDSALVKFFD